MTALRAQTLDIWECSLVCLCDWAREKRCVHSDFCKCRQLPQSSGMQSDWVRATCRRTKPLAEVTTTTPTHTNTAFVQSLKKTVVNFSLTHLVTRKTKLLHKYLINYTPKVSNMTLPFHYNQQSCHSRFTVFYVTVWALQPSSWSDCPHQLWTLINTIIIETVYTAK